MLDDLRNSTLSNANDRSEESYGNEIADIKARRQFLGLSAAERMMLSIFLFMTITVLMVALLIASGRIVL